jgi:hypothetical protein
MPRSDRDRTRAPPIERFAANVVRSVHLAAVVAVGAWVLGAQVPAALALWAVLGSGAVLLAMDLAAGRLHLAEAAGAVVALKLALLLAALWQPAWAGPIFFGVLVLSSLAAHAPKGWRHLGIRPRREAPDSAPASRER